MVCRGVQLIHMLVIEGPNFCIFKPHPAPRYIEDNFVFRTRSNSGKRNGGGARWNQGGAAKKKSRFHPSKFKFPAQRISSVEQETTKSQAVDDGFAKARKMVAMNGTIKLVTFNLIIEHTEVETMWKAGQSEAEQTSSRGWALEAEPGRMMRIHVAPLANSLNHTGSSWTFSHVCCWYVVRWTNNILL